jgi:hypothetical protein
MSSVLAIAIPWLRESAKRKKIRMLSRRIHLVRGEMSFVPETRYSETNRLVIGLSIRIVIATKGASARDDA